MKLLSLAEVGPGLPGDREVGAPGVQTSRPVRVDCSVTNVSLRRPSAAGDPSLLCLQRLGWDFSGDREDLSAGLLSWFSPQ